MLKNYIKIAWRNLVQHKTFSLLNILGLALSISAGLIILLLYQDGYSYDTFHSDPGSIYRVNSIANRKNGQTEPYATTPPSIGKHLESNFTWIDKIATLTVLDGEITKGNQTIKFQGKITQQTFLEIFNFKLASGDVNTVLQRPNSIVLSPQLKEKLFGNANAIGNTIQINNHELYNVTGVLKPTPGKTHFEFEALLSPGHEEQDQVSWFDLSTTYTYIKLKPHTGRDAAIKALNQGIAPLFKHLPSQSPDGSYVFDLQALPEITPGYSIANGMGKGMPIHLLRFLALMGFVVMASAIFNYTNLTLAKSFRRAKEMGVRKVMGATPQQVLLQIIIEGVVLSLVALLVAFFFLIFFRSELNRLQSFRFFDLNVSITPMSIVYFIVFAFLTGAVAGFIPAITMSKLNAVSTLRKIENINIIRRVGLAKILLVVQLVLSMLFIMIATTLRRQVQFAIRMDYGFTTDQIYNVQLQGISPDVAKAKFNSLPGVVRISAMNIPMGTYDNTTIAFKINKADEVKKINSYSIDENLIPNLQLRLVAGENFESNWLSNTGRVIVNEMFIKNNRLGNASEAIGKVVFLNDTTTARISGVVKDFFFKPADEPITSLILRYDPAEWKFLNVHLAANRSEQTITGIKTAWKEIAPNRELKGELYATTIRNNYGIIEDVNKVIQFFSLLGLVICLMGLSGMAIYSVEKRQKEVSLRKVLGATHKQIVFALSKNFVKLLMAGFVISIPLGLIICGQILNNFANRINPGLNIIFPGFIILTVLAMVIIASQTIKAAIANPVKSLRTE